jgi:hypothetical protein
MRSVSGRPLACDGEGVIAPGLEGHGQVGEDARAVVPHHRRASMHQSARGDHPPTERDGQRLMAEAYAENGYASEACPKHVEASAGRLRATGPR